MGKVIKIKEASVTREFMERKKAHSFAIAPSVYVKACEVAKRQGKSISKVVNDFLEEYVRGNSAN